MNALSSIERTPVAHTMDIDALYRTHHHKVLSRCRRLLSDEADAMEAAQEVFERLARSAPNYRGEAKPSTLLFRITTHHCLNRLRQRRTRREDAVGTLTGVARSTVDHVELQQLIVHLLQGEDPITRECATYRYVDGMTLAEVGMLIGVSEAAVRKRLRRFVTRAKDRHSDDHSRS